MSNLQKIKAVANKHGLTFKPTNAALNGAKLYNFVNKSGFAVARNWTVDSAINEYWHGDLIGKIS